MTTPTPSNPSINLSLKAWGTLIAILGGSLGLFTKVAVPMILDSTEIQTRQMIESYDEKHTIVPHAGAATTADLERVIDRIAPLATQMDVERVRSDMRALDTRVEAVQEDVSEVKRELDRRDN